MQIFSSDTATAIVPRMTGTGPAELQNRAGETSRQPPIFANFPCSSPRWATFLLDCLVQSIGASVLAISSFQEMMNETRLFCGAGIGIGRNLDRMPIRNGINSPATRQQCGRFRNRINCPACRHQRERFRNVGVHPGQPQSPQHDVRRLCRLGPRRFDKNRRCRGHCHRCRESNMHVQTEEIRRRLPSKAGGIRQDQRKAQGLRNPVARWSLSRTLLHCVEGGALHHFYNPTISTIPLCPLAHFCTLNAHSRSRVAAPEGLSTSAEMLSGFKNGTELRSRVAGLANSTLLFPVSTCRQHTCRASGCIERRHVRSRKEACLGASFCGISDG